MADTFWSKPPEAPQALWPLRANGLSAAELAQLQGFAEAVLDLFAAQREEAELLGLDSSPALYASALHAHVATLEAAWPLDWPDRAESLLDALLARELGRALPSSSEDFARELALFFHQATL